MPVPTAAGSEDRAASPSAIAGLATLLAGTLFLGHALLDPTGVVARPAGSWLFHLLVVPFACLGLAALLRVRLHGPRFPLGWAAVEALLGAGLVVTGAGVLAVVTPSIPTTRLVVLAVVIGVACVASAVLVTGMAYVTDPREPSRVGYLLVGWPVVSLVWRWLVVRLGTGGFVTPVLGSVGMALALDGLQACVRSRRRVPVTGARTRAANRPFVPP